LEKRKFWDQYTEAYEDALQNTSMKHAPWHVAPANSKMNRNLYILQVLVHTLEGLKLTYPDLQEYLQGVVVE
jgi:polyphosphate kinase 2 (PPK2 family)